MIFDLTCEFRAAEKGDDGMALKIFARARPFPKADMKPSGITEIWALSHRVEQLIWKKDFDILIFSLRNNPKEECMLKSLIFGLSLIGFIFLLATSTNAAANNPKVLMKTTKGDITIELYQDKAPLSVENFLSYVEEKFYDGTIFHRVIKGFMIQGGGYTADFHEKPSKDPIQNEAKNGLKNKRGTIAMARMPEPHTATCQFFINHVDNAGLDYGQCADGWGYAVFGKVIQGMDVVDAIANSPTMTKSGMRDVPRETIQILSVTKIE
jgi:cyclophilin family peptidyl-prolyl cis-trans isomerase